MPVFKASHTIMMYMALPQEVQTATMMATARRQHKRVVIPVIRGYELVAVECPADASQFQRGPYGILEPRSMPAAVRPEAIDCVLVPGVGFDSGGTRLGFGRGYYDRFLSQLPTTTAYGGLAFHLQIVPRLPHMAHDICMSFVVTEQGVMPCMHALPQDGDEWGQDKGEHR